MKPNYSRRDFLGAVGLTAGAYITAPALLSAIPAPASRVAIGQCPEYNRQVRDVLATMFDQLGGLAIAGARQDRRHQAQPDRPHQRRNSPPCPAR